MLTSYFSFIMFSVDRKMRLEESDVSCGLEMLHSGSEIQMQLDNFFLLASLHWYKYYVHYIIPESLNARDKSSKIFIHVSIYSQNATPYTFIICISVSLSLEYQLDSLSVNI